MNKYGLQMVIKLASCYGLKASAQGSGKKHFVVVSIFAFAAIDSVRSNVSFILSVRQLAHHPVHA